MTDHRARWEDALDLAIHLNDQIRSGQLIFAHSGPDRAPTTLAEYERTKDPDELVDVAKNFTCHFMRRTIAIAEPVYVSPDVQDAWQHAADTFRPEVITEAEPFTPVALVVLPRPQHLDGRMAPCRALMWGISQIDDANPPMINIIGFTRAEDLAEQAGRPIPDTLRRRWLFISTWVLPIGRRPDSSPTAEEWLAGKYRPVDEAERRELWRQLQSLWRLARSFVIVPERASRAGRRAAKRARLVHDENVTVIRLRRQRHEEPDIEHPVDWQCRWLVRGHWRHLPDGRQTWVMAHVKGPDDKPFRSTDRVWEFVR
jgi:hypothetical protein